jgi:serine/threonine-protein kinase
MSPERWAQLEPLVDVALELSPTEQAAYCNEIATTDPALGAALRRLLQQPSDTGSLFDHAAEERLALLSDPGRGAPAAQGDLLQLVQASLGATYIVEQEIGGGGMSRVFIAHEPALGRRVVVKLLSPELAAGINADRFAREIKLAASLQQANIVPLLSTGIAAGCPFYTMPFVDGRSLRDRLARESPLPIGDAVSILRDVARALAFAHGRGVVHRDVKPGNVLLSGGTAMVTDFGIAKALVAAGTVSHDRPERGSVRDLPDAPEITLTEIGSSLGTPAYMAPEQATGDPHTDHRADLYAFGCMAYELFSGKPPFYGGPMHKIIAAHLNQTPRPITERRADIPPGIADVIGRCLEKDPADRPQTAAEILVALDGASPAPAARTRAFGRAPIVAAIATAVALAGGALVRMNRAPPEPLTLAAIPFRNVAHDTTLDYRSDGIRDEILTAMARVPGVQIVGRSAAYRYKDRLDGSDVRTVARDLGVRLLVTGTLREQNGQVTISAQLNDSSSRAELWAGTFVRESKDFGSIADDIVHTIADTLHARFGDRVGAPQRQVSTLGTTNPEALDLYLLGQEQLKRRGEGVTQSAANFERAIQLDPKFARAYAALATALQLYPYFVGTLPQEVKDTTIATANRALTLDSTLADPHVALGTAYAQAGRWDEAFVEFQRGVDRDPDDVPARVAYGRYLVITGRPAEAMTQLQEGKRVERVSPLISAWIAYAYYAEGQMDSAYAESQKAIQLDSTFLPAANVGMLVRLAQGKLDEARRVALRARPDAMTNAPYVLAKTGDTASANRMVRAMQTATPRPWFADPAEAAVALALGDSAAALSALERSQRRSGRIWAEYMGVFVQTYHLVRQSPRFIALVKQANLDMARFDQLWRGR